MEFYDVGTSDLKELWESYLVEPDVLMTCTKEDDWGSVLSLRDRTSFGVVLRDRLMTDAALGGPKPIKTEHSYSLLASSPPRSPATPGANQYTPIAGSSTDTTPGFSGTIIPANDHQKSRLDVTDMEEECFPAISMNTASGRESSSSTPDPMCSNAENIQLSRHHISNEDSECTFIKGEPLSAPSSPCEPCPSIADVRTTVTMVSPHRLHFATLSPATDTDEEEDEEFCHAISIEEFNMACQANGEMTSLPPTPPSSASSDNESNVSASCSPQRRDSQCSTINIQNISNFLTTSPITTTAPRLYVNAVQPQTHAPRQPIHTPLISCQPKGSTGMLILTDEEKRTLIAEGYPVPTKLPLSKAEEKSLKKVRRKIKNKISAQESRRKKKEYMDGLERRVSVLAGENSSYRDRVTVLENTNRQLLKELAQLQSQLQRSS